MINANVQDREAKCSNSPDALAERIWRREMNVLRSVTRRFKTSQFGPIRRYEWTIRVRRREDVVTLHDCIQWLLQGSVVAECQSSFPTEYTSKHFTKHAPPKLLRILQILHRRPRTMAETSGENRCLTSPKLGVLDILKNN
ncbi:hypothetical protein PROFUN_12003 [Planoprotostelium fungivorum]|uniref:Uncharacterized protein n=1 Tax=Planoprotostelium fungivorum TaxID=1890364 RepID=A0A2P6MRE5_9EUKA|nr:hypothetical protein PROFUN_12003 [Planoprotostelium fungivorum]